MTKPLKNKILKLIEKIETFQLFSKRYEIKKSYEWNKLKRGQIC